MSNFNFDKFMNDIVNREKKSADKKKQYVKDHKDHPMRKIKKLYQEKWQNRIRFRGQRNAKK